MLKQTVWLQLSSTEIQTRDPDHNRNVTIDALTNDLQLPLDLTSKQELNGK